MGLQKPAASIPEYIVYGLGFRVCRPPRRRQAPTARVPARKACLLRMQNAYDKCRLLVFLGWVLVFFLGCYVVCSHSSDVFVGIPECSKDMPRDERKRHYATIGRMCRLDPVLAGKFSMLKTHGEKFQFLKEAILADSDQAEVAVSQETVTAHTTTNQDRYRRVTKFQLQQTYGSSDAALAFIEKLCEGQDGEYHPQALGYSPGKTYRILKDVAENVGTAMRNESKVRVF